MENTELSMVEARRSFLKKVAYTAPAVIALGALTLPSSAQASVFTHNTQSVPATNPATSTSTETITTIDGTNIVTSGTSDSVPANTLLHDDYTGTQVKQLAEGTNTWKWVNDLFGGAAKWLGV